MNMLFDFTINKETKTIHITREFAAGPDLVWDAFTKAEILDKWVAPKPMRLQTKEMDFREGGRWLYGMIINDTPPSRFSLAEFIKITPKTSFTTRNSFVDENCNAISSASSITTNTFKEGGAGTIVHIEKVMSSLEALEMMATNGFVQGTEAGMKNLDEYFSNIAATK
ncbi:MAG TPA: SRPBCC domain-containing protein [Chitinophagaceae bacterium]|nr:SRPBCC domain-containing protein [Chitinophagaceae bacterium]